MMKAVVLLMLCFVACQAYYYQGYYGMPQYPGHYVYYPRYKLQDIGETFTEDDRWKLRIVDEAAVETLLKNLKRQPWVWNQMTPNSEVFVRLLNTMRKMQRMKKRYELYKEMNKQEEPEKPEEEPEVITSDQPEEMS